MALLWIDEGILLYGLFIVKLCLPYEIDIKSGLDVCMSFECISLVKYTFI